MELLPIQQESGDRSPETASLIFQALAIQEDVDCDNVGLANYQSRYGKIALGRDATIIHMAEEYRKFVSSMTPAVRASFRNMFPFDPAINDPLRLTPNVFQAPALKKNRSDARDAKRRAFAAAIRKFAPAAMIVIGIVAALHGFATGDHITAGHGGMMMAGIGGLFGTPKQLSEPARRVYEALQQFTKTNAYPAWIRFDEDGHLKAALGSTLPADDAIVFELYLDRDGTLKIDNFLEFSEPSALTEAVEFYNTVPKYSQAASESNPKVNRAAYKQALEDLILEFRSKKFSRQEMTAFLGHRVDAPRYAAVAGVIASWLIAHPVLSEDSGADRARFIWEAYIQAASRNERDAAPTLGPPVTVRLTSKRDGIENQSIEPNEDGLVRFEARQQYSSCHFDHRCSETNRQTPAG